MILLESLSQRKAISNLIFLCFFSLKLSAASVGSKTFTESYILAEIAAQKIEKFTDVNRQFGLGGTGILFEALKNSKIDIYPEYSGTVAEALLKQPDLKDINAIQAALKKMGIFASNKIGFNNTYALAMKREEAEALGIREISDLKKFPTLKMGLSYEFLRRSDGWLALAKAYSLKMENVKGMEHSLSYSAVESSSIDIIDVYTTDAKLKELDLYLLTDDLKFFPRYDALFLASKKFVQEQPEAWQAIRELEGQIDENQMTELNSKVDLEDASFASVAANFLSRGASEIQTRQNLPWRMLWKRSREHLYLVFFSLLASVFIGVPLGIWAAKSKMAAKFIISGSGIIQTIPSLALLCFFIPFLGIGTVPALSALFLYALLPIVRGTYSGLLSIDRDFLEVTQVLGMKPIQSLLKVELPLAAVPILNGIKTSMVINVGTATLAAFIGAGGLGSFIVTGLALNEVPTILLGAIPSAILALLLQYIFELLDRLFVPTGLRIA